MGGDEAGEESGHSWESWPLEALEAICQPSFLRPHSSGKARDRLFSFLQFIKAHYKVGEVLDTVLLRLLLQTFEESSAGPFLVLSQVH